MQASAYILIKKASISIQVKKATLQLQTKPVFLGLPIIQMIMIVKEAINTTISIFPTLGDKHVLSTMTNMFIYTKK